MKLFIVSALTLFSIGSIASGPMNSSALAGHYKLTEANGTYALSDYCPAEIQVNVNENGVFLYAIVGNGYAGFWTKDEGCDYRAGDISPVRITCTDFSRRSTTSSSTEPLSIVGYVRESEGLSLHLLNDHKLTFSKNVTEIPFGVLGIWDNQEFECEYERL